MSAALTGLPRKIGRYELTGLLGQGGMGRVVSAHDPVLKREVALKLFEPESVAPENLAEARFLFHREARATAALKHPSILEVYDYSGPDAEIGFLACELLSGPTLRELFDKEGAMPPEVVAALGYELASALEHAHTKGIVHRDVKPENVFWLDEGRVVLTDFGIAKALDGMKRLGNTVQFGATSVYGSPAYMAPEQLSGGEVGPRTDLHALGAVFYEALTGEQAFDGPDIDAILQRVLADDRPRLAGRSDAPPAFVALVNSLLAKDPKDRALSANVVVSSLRQILDGLEVSDPRLILRGYGEETAALSGEDREPAATARFEDVEPQGVKLDALERASDLAQGPWKEHAPLLLGTLGLAIGLGIVAYLFVDLSGAIGHLQGADEPAAVDVIAKAPPSELVMDVPVVIRFPGHGKVEVDGRDAGVGDGVLRIRLVAGPHRLTLRRGNEEHILDVLVLESTEPVFDFGEGPESPDK